MAKAIVGGEEIEVSFPNFKALKEFWPYQKKIQTSAGDIEIVTEGILGMISAGGAPKWAQPLTARSTVSREILSGARSSQAPPPAPVRVPISPARASMAVTRRTTTGLVGTEAARQALDTAPGAEKASLWAR